MKKRQREANPAVTFLLLPLLLPYWLLKAIAALGKTPKSRRKNP